MRSKSLILFLLLTGFSVSGQAQQPWAGVLSPSRASSTWAVAGADTAYVNENRTQCGSTIAAYGTSGSPASAATINTAIASCAAAHPLSGPGGYVLLGPGDFYINTEITFSSPSIYSNVTLRGSGASQTTIHFSGSSTNCPFAGGADICFSQETEGNGFGLGYDGSADNFASWTASSYAQGTTTITINNFSKGKMANWQVGSLIFLDQLDTSNSPPPASGLAVCRSGKCGGDNVSGRPGRSLTEPQVITSISGSGPWTVGITPGIRMPNWFNAGSSPQVWGNSGLPIQRDGVENMSIDISNALNRFSTDLCLGCYNVWIKGVRFYDTHGDSETGQDGFYHFYPIQSMRVTMQDSYAYGSPPVSNYYVMSCWTSGDELYQNNIRQHVAFGFMAEGCVNWVHAYNFDIDDYYTHCHGCSTDTQWQQASSYRHGGTDALGLYEGNVGIGAVGDLVFGASSHITHFRNFYNGRDPNGGSTGSGKTEQTNAILLYPVNRYWNIIGNVFGTAGYHTTYQCAYPSPGSCNNDLQIYSLGYANGYPAADEAYVATSMMRWGNFDTVSNAVRWQSSEVPSSLSDGFANVVPSTVCTSSNPSSCPASFYLNTQPTWWAFSTGTPSPWPGIGPDVSGGNITSGTGAASTLGGHAYLNPAANCYLNVMKGPTDGSATVMPFDANTCYPSAVANAPLPPSNLNATVQ